MLPVVLYVTLHLSWAQLAGFDASNLSAASPGPMPAGNHSAMITSWNRTASAMPYLNMQWRNAVPQHSVTSVAEPQSALQTHVAKPIKLEYLLSQGTADHRFSSCHLATLFTAAHHLGQSKLQSPSASIWPVEDDMAAAKQACADGNIQACFTQYGFSNLCRQQPVQQQQWYEKLQGIFASIDLPSIAGLQDFLVRNWVSEHLYS